MNNINLKDFFESLYIRCSPNGPIEYYVEHFDALDRSNTYNEFIWSIVQEYFEENDFDNKNFDSFYQMVLFNDFVFNIFSKKLGLIDSKKISFLEYFSTDSSEISEHITSFIK